MPTSLSYATIAERLGECRTLGYLGLAACSLLGVSEKTSPDTLLFLLSDDGEEGMLKTLIESRLSSRVTKYPYSV